MFTTVDQAVAVRISGSDWISDFVADGVETLPTGGGTGETPNYQFTLDTVEYSTVPTFQEYSQTRGVWEVSVESPRTGLPRPQTLSVGVGQGIFGANKNALRVDVQESTHGSGGTFLRLHNAHGATGYWFVRDYANWTDLKRINRMRFWMRVHDGYLERNSNQANFHVGTFLMESGGSSTGESNNWHFYHVYNIEYTDSWLQVIVDTHPHHIRGADGSVEQNDKIEMEPGYGYFDLLTYFYFAFIDSSSIDPHTNVFDGIEFYEVVGEDTDHIHSMSGTYSAAGELILKWRCRKDETDTFFQVKYSFSSFHENGGFGFGSLAPGGDSVTCISTLVPSGFAGVEYRTKEINLRGQTAIYFAVKHESQATKFREFRIPLTLDALPALPNGTPDLTEP